MRILASVALATLLGLSRPTLAAGPPAVDSTIKLQGASGRDAAVIIGNEAYAALPQATYAAADAKSVQNMLVNGLGLSKSRLVYTENASSASTASVGAFSSAPWLSTQVFWSARCSSDGAIGRPSRRPVQLT